MQELHCHRCKSAFYTAARRPRMPCPYCGFSQNERERRDGKRMASLRNCDLSRGDVKVQVKTIDISDTGMGIRMKG
ncbi:MAG: PilZ domain-containing protein, partial [Deltaproteobacteria bacterium]